MAKMVFFFNFMREKKQGDQFAPSPILNPPLPIGVPVILIVEKNQ